MAKSDSAVMDPEAVDQDGNPVVVESKPKQKSKPGIFVALPVELIAAITSRGEAENKPNGRVAAECVAQLFGYELPPLDRVRKGGAADSTGLTAKAKNSAITRLIELARSGEIELTPDLKALLGV